MNPAYAHVGVQRADQCARRVPSPVGVSRYDRRCSARGGGYGTLGYVEINVMGVRNR
jgi:hypothetical protein